MFTLDTDTSKLQSVTRALKKIVVVIVWCSRSNISCYVDIMKTPNN